MKKQVFLVMAVLVTVGFGCQLFAQEATVNTSRSNIKNNKSSIDSPGTCVGKIRCADGSCIISFEQDIVSPRDAASGLPTGKRMHKPFVITKELDRSSPAAIRESPTKASTGKVSYSDLSVMLTCNGRTTKLPVINGQFTLPADGKDNDCDLVVSWSWGESNSGSSATRYEATFNLALENGEYMASKHTKTGHVTLMK
ncbi:MAG: type VI secretion system tube protein Hcp [Prolixibacteraceae bacterium]|nr:type VI secretion system tube protein Hcp [Prolixibacteraceae bacterium]